MPGLPETTGKGRKGRVPIIGVMGGSAFTPGTNEAELAYEVGRRIALAGAVLLTGGGGGVMFEASRGASEAGGLVLGVLPGSARDEANPFVDVAVVTGMGSARNRINTLTADAVIAIGGGPGTLSEIALALIDHREVVGLFTWRLTRPDGEVETRVVATTSAEQAVSVALALAGV